MQSVATLVQSRQQEALPIISQRDSRGHEALREVLHTLRIHDEEFKNNAAPKEVESFWNIVAERDQTKMFADMSERSESFFITKSIFKLMKEFGERLPKNLAFAPAGRNILVWAEVNDDDVDGMRQIVRAIARVNGSNDNSDIELIPEIVETSDRREVPEKFLSYENA